MAKASRAAVAVRPVIRMKPRLMLMDWWLFPIGGVGRGRRVAAGVGVEVFR